MKLIGRVAIFLVIILLLFDFSPYPPASGPSAAVALTSAVSPSLQVLSPNGGEFWKAGSTQSITWTSSGVTGEVKIEISYNRGKTWETLISSTSNDGNEPWTLSGQLSSGCQIRVTNLSDRTVLDTSDANFDVWDFNSWEPLTAGYDGGGGVMTIAVKPGDSKIVVAGRGADGGGYTSTNGGESWEADATALASASLWDFAFIPGTDTVLACGDKLFRSVDNGQTWQDYWTPTSQIRCVEVDPNDSTRIFLGCSGDPGGPVGDVYRSTDSGESWTQTITGLDPGNLKVNAIVFEPDNPKRIFAATGGYWFDTGGSGVYYSDNGGDTWSAFNEGLGSPDVRCLAITPSTASSHFLYAGTCTGPVYRYNLDTGTQWEVISPGYYGARTIAMDPQTPSTIYTVFAPDNDIFRVYKSVDSGGSWFAASTGLWDAYSVCITVDPNIPSILFIAIGGQAICRSIDGAAHWEPSNAGFGVGFNSATTRADDPNTIFALMAGGATTMIGGPVIRSLDGGMNWTCTSTGLNVEGTGLYRDPLDKLTSYESQVNQSGLFRTTDGGESWTTYNDGFPLEQFKIEAPNGGVVCLVGDPKTPDLLYTGTGTGVFKRVNGQWTAINNGLAPDASPRLIESLVINWQDPKVLYAGVRNEGVWKTTDAGANWEAVNNGFGDTAALKDKWVFMLAIDKDDPNILYAGTWRGVFKTTNGGSEWIRIGDAVSTQFVALHPQNINTVYAGIYGTEGIYCTRDGGTTWGPMNEGIMSKRSEWMGIDPNSPGYLYVANSRGLYRYISPSLFFTELQLYRPVEAGSSVGAVLGGLMNNPAAQNGGVAQTVRGRLQLVNLDPSLISSAQLESPDAPGTWINVTPTPDGAGGSYLWMDRGYSLLPGESKPCRFRLTVQGTAPVSMHRTVLSLIDWSDPANPNPWVLATKTGQLTVVQESAPVQNGIANLTETGVQLAVTVSGTAWGGIYQGQPAGTTTPSETVSQYLDVCFTPEKEYTGTVTVIVRYATPERPAIKVPNSFRYWDGSVWRPADPQVNDLEQQALIGHVPAVYLQGTPLALEEGDLPFPSSLTLTPSQATQTVGASSPFTALAEDPSGNPIAGLPLLFTVSGAHPQTATATSDGSGWAAFSYTATSVGEDAIRASFGGILSNPASQSWTPASLDHFAFSAIPSPQTAGLPFPITLTAHDSYHNPVLSFIESVSLFASNGSVTPSATGLFRAGVWSGSLAVDHPDLAVTLLARKGSISGTSPPFQVDPRTATLSYDLVTGWNLLSLPLITTPSPQILFSPLPSGWLLYAWDAVHNRYLGKAEISLSAGIGYWLKLPVSSPLSLSGIELEEEGQLALSEGWNLIGSPFSQDLPLERVKILRQGETLSFLEAAIHSPPWVMGSLYGWQGGQYEDAATKGILQPGQGYWQKTLLPGCVLLFQPAEAPQ